MAWGFVPAELRHAGFWDAGVCVPVALPPPLCLPQCNIIIFIFQNGTILIWLLSNVDCRLNLALGVALARRLVPVRVCS